MAHFFLFYNTHFENMPVNSSTEWTPVGMLGFHIFFFPTVIYLSSIELWHRDLLTHDTWLSIPRLPSCSNRPLPDRLPPRSSSRQDDIRRRPTEMRTRRALATAAMATTIWQRPAAGQHSCLLASRLFLSCFSFILSVTSLRFDWKIQMSAVELYFSKVQE